MVNQNPIRISVLSESSESKDLSCYPMLTAALGESLAEGLTGNVSQQRVDHTRAASPARTRR